LQRVARQGASAGWGGAADRPRTWSVGGKTPRAPGPQRILEPPEPPRAIAPAPQAHGGTITLHLPTDPQIGGLVGGCCPQDQPTPERQGLGRAMRAYERL